MWIEITAHEVVLADTGDFMRFHVAAPADMSMDRLDAELRASGWGRVEGERAAISIRVLRSHGVASPSWLTGFNSMVEFAASRGWVTADANFLLAHIEGSMARSRPGAPIR